ncbi:MAG: bifunctional diaminohydroxyphosphoribosylaminopyrimidine deaminase/5-amino-6-(5-phosphoribosylamino)uracil reductase RibD [Bacteroidales bacterium]|nr:bifunctional diaminohydroxyphosphoribosylaminopyrimidine deaminase/5-amino-6-(5-phosphoribosylamino)uracil reductase RibD [Bacteroidales bacterium]
MISGNELQYLHLAIDRARLGAGFCNPNPMVGAVIVRHGQVLASGYHAAYGSLHAERDAFRCADAAQIDCTGATMYVTLEPCCHHGKQPPCTEAIIEHRIARVVVAQLDPNPLVAGKGIEQLREAGIEVDVLDANHPIVTELTYLNRTFLKFITTRRPWVLAKYAMTLDGKICTHTGHSQWISGEASRHRVHQLRHEMAAILCGIGTVLADDPMLNTRLPEMPNAHNPIRIVADRQLRIPLKSQLVQSARQIPLIVVHGPEADAIKVEELHTAGVETWCCESLHELLQKAGEHKICSILLEGGGTLNEAFLSAGLIDEVFAFIAPKLIGGSEAKTPIEGKGFSRMTDAIELFDIHTETLGNDILVRGLVNKKTSL